MDAIWEKEFRQSRAGKAALSKLHGLEQINPKNFWHLEERVLEACYQAQNYKACSNIDENSHRRDKDQQFITDIENLPLVHHAKQLRGVIESNQPQADISLFRGFSQLKKDKGNLTPLPKGARFSDYAIQALKIIEYGLAATNKDNLMDFAPNYQHGCLLFPKKIGNMTIRRRLPTVETMLLFHLCLYFRRWTGGEPAMFASINNGERMPDYGKPNYPIAWHFVTATLEKRPPNKSEVNNSYEAPRKRLTMLLKRNPEISLISSWQ